MNHHHGKPETGSSPRVMTGIAGRRLAGLVAGTVAGAAAGAVIGNTAIGPVGAVVGGALCGMLGALLGHAAAEALWPTLDLYSMRTPSRIESRGSGRAPWTQRTASGNPYAPSSLGPTAATDACLVPAEARLPARPNSAKETR